MHVPVEQWTLLKGISSIMWASRWAVVRIALSRPTPSSMARSQLGAQPRDSPIGLRCVGRGGDGGRGPAHPSTRLVVLQVHKHPALLLRSLGKVLLPLPGIHKLLSKPVAVLHVVPTAAPQPVPGKVLGPRCPAAATCGQLTLSAGPADGVHHPRGAHSIGEGRLPAPCKTRQDGAKEVSSLVEASSPLPPRDPWPQPQRNTPRSGLSLPMTLMV